MKNKGRFIFISVLIVLIAACLFITRNHNSDIQEDRRVESVNNKDISVELFNNDSYEEADEARWYRFAITKGDSKVEGVQVIYFKRENDILHEKEDEIYPRLTALYRVFSEVWANGYVRYGDTYVPADIVEEDLKMVVKNGEDELFSWNIQHDGYDEEDKSNSYKNFGEWSLKKEFFNTERLLHRASEIIIATREKEFEVDIINRVKCGSQWMDIFPEGTLNKKNLKLSFDDENFEKCIRAIIGKDKGEDIWKEDLSNITELDLSSSGVKNLKGIENFSELQKLNVSDNEIDDIRGLNRLSKLTELDVTNCKIKSLEDIGKLSKLEVLSIGNFRRGRLYSNKYKNLKDIAGLRNLKELNIHCTKTELDGIEHLKNLEGLNLAFNRKIQSLSPIKKLTKLKRLDIRHTNIDDITVLKNMTNLEMLNIANTSIDDITVLKNVKSLEILNIANIYIRDIEVINELKHLRELIAWNVIDDKDYSKLKAMNPDMTIEYKMEEKNR